MSTVSLVSLLACLSGFAFFFLSRPPRVSSVSRLPPGPRPLPFFGNIFNLPSTKEWETFSRWKQQYGDIVYLRLFGKRLVILNTLRATSELLDKRSHIYSDRPSFPVLDIAGHPEFSFTFMQYGTRWRHFRRFFVPRFQDIEHLETYDPCLQDSNNFFLRALRTDPEHFLDHARLHAGQIILDTVYGIKITKTDDPLIQIAEAVMHTVSIGVNPIMWIVNPLKLAKLLPSWLGGREYAAQVSKWKKDIVDLKTIPFQKVKDDLLRGDARPSFVSTLLEEIGDGSRTDVTEADVRDTAAVAYGAASDTTVSVSTTFFLCMTLNQEAQLKAQAEIDRVVGTDRLPKFADQELLPQTTAILKETLRWNPATPQGVPHLLKKDDIYEGYFLPKGTIIMGNVWEILHDPSVYPDPLSFKPERFISQGKLSYRDNDPSEVVFGFGRRICAGQNFAERSLWLLIAQTLALYRIAPAPSETNELPKAEFTSGAISHPLPFKCEITPRSESARSLIEHLDSV